nr:helix-turn-helix transcriptional regulator [uncultured Acetobacter sp.]
MIRPDELWDALDALALEQGLTPSGLARAAGLDPTTFNPSRRRSADGTLRWMALPSLLRALDVLKISPALFVRRLEDGARGHEGALVQRLRGLPLSRLRGSGLFDSAGHPTGVVWDEVVLPCAVAGAGEAYAVRIDTDTMEPLLREGSSLVIMPDMPPRRSDRVLLWRSGMEPVLGTLVEKIPEHTAQASCWVVQPFAALAAEHGMTHALEDTEAAKDSADPEQDGVPVPEGKSGIWLHRIVIGTF